MKAWLIALTLGALVVAPVFCRDLQGMTAETPVPPPPRPRGTTAAQCVTESKATLDIRGVGSGGFARGAAYCRAEADARSDIQTIVVDWADDVYEDPETACTVNEAIVDAEAIATAYATAFTTAQTEVGIVGTGQACADAFAAGDALADALVDIYVQIVLNVVSTAPIDDPVTANALKDFDEEPVKGNNAASGEAVGRAVANAIASAWASASSDACTTGGFESDFQSAFASEISDVVAYLYAGVIVTICESLQFDTDALKEWQEALSDSESFVDGAIEGTTTTVVETTEGGAAEVGSQCSGRVASNCCRSSFLDTNPVECDCGSTCSARETAAFAITEGAEATKFWEVNDGTMCWCS